nr:hypothetical protein [Tanacetum cinerariifolium]
DEPTSSQFPQSYLNPEGDILLLKALLNDDHSSDFKTKSSSTSLNSLLEETNTFDNYLPKSDTPCFDVEEISSGSTTTHSDISLPEYEASYDDQSFSDEDHPDNAESDLMQSLRTHDSSLLISSKIDSLLDEFAGKLTLLKSIPLGIDETDCDFEEDIRLIERLFDSLMEEIDLSCTPDYPMPPGIEDDEYNSERDILILKDLPSNNTLSFAEKEPFHFDIPSFCRHPAKPLDEPLYGFLPCQWCTCERCGIDMLNGICPLCNSSNSCAYDHNPNSFDYPPDSYHLSHPTYETYSGDSCGNDSHFGYDCRPQFPLNYKPEPGYIQNYNSYPHDSPSFP